VAFLKKIVLAVVKMVLFCFRLNHLYILYVHPFHIQKDYFFLNDASWITAVCLAGTPQLSWKVTKGGVWL